MKQKDTRNIKNYIKNDTKMTPKDTSKKQQLFSEKPSNKPSYT